MCLLFVLTVAPPFQRLPTHDPSSASALSDNSSTSFRLSPPRSSPIVDQAISFLSLCSSLLLFPPPPSPLLPPSFALLFPIFRLPSSVSIRSRPSTFSISSLAPRISIVLVIIRPSIRLIQRRQLRRRQCRALAPAVVGFQSLVSPLTPSPLPPWRSFYVFVSFSVSPRWWKVSIAVDALVCSSSSLAAGGRLARFAGVF